MKNIRKHKHSFQMNFMRGRMITPSVAAPDGRDGLKRPVLAKHGIGIWSRDHDGNGNNHSDAIAAGSELDATTLLSPPHSLLGYKPP